VRGERSEGNGEVEQRLPSRLPASSSSAQNREL
jgi:hypothetical protein